MTKLNVWYSPTRTNKQIVTILSQMDHFKGCEFIPLLEDSIRRKWQVEELTRDGSEGVLLYGNTKKQDLSYLFSRYNKNARSKANLSHFSATVICPGAYFNTFMRIAERNGMNTLHAGSGVQNITELTERIRQFDCGENSLSLTIAGDAITGLPISKWVFEYIMESNGLHPQKVRDLIALLGRKTLLLDLGGVVEKIPQFTAMPEIAGVDISTIVPPTSEDAHAFSINVETERPMPQELIDRMGSYVTAVYGALIGAFAKARGY